MSITIDPPVKLPIRNLSVSSMNLLAACPLSWKRRYVDGEYEPTNGKMLIGSAVGAAENQHFSEVIETGEGYSLERVEDEFSAEWDLRVEGEPVDWQGEQPGAMKDSGLAVLGAFHTTIAPQIVPTSVEREFQLTWPGVDWGLQGFLDLEEADGSVGDMKMKGQRWSQWKADRDIQPSSYLLARRTEGNPAPRFRYHVGVRVKTPYAEIVDTERTDRQLDAFQDRVFAAAREIAWRAEHDIWQAADPGNFRCSPKFCGHWRSCSFGGLR